MVQSVDAASLAVVGAVAGAAFGATAWALRLAVEAVRRRNGNGGRPGGYRSEDHLLLKQTHATVRDTDGQVRDMAALLRQSLTEERRQTEMMARVAEGIHDLKLELRGRR